VTAEEIPTPERESISRRKGEKIRREVRIGRKGGDKVIAGYLRDLVEESVKVQDSVP
jgi:hypothetical protein